MSDGKVRIQLLGSIKLEKDGIVIHDGDNRSKKLWLLMSYLMINNKQRISQDKLISVMWPDDDMSANPSNALKTLFHRTRGVLDGLGDGYGRELLQCKRGEYFFHSTDHIIFDFEEFEKYIAEAREVVDDERKFELLINAFNLYNGDLLSKFSSEAWIIPIATYYHNMYLDVTNELIELCESTEEYDRAIMICNKATEVEPFDESLYIHLMNNLLALHKYQEVVNTYQTLSDMLASNFGVKPSENVRAIYREASQNLETSVLDICEIQKRLDEPTTTKRGALYCDFDFFGEIYHALSRGVERAGSALHLAVITITDVNDAPLSKRSLTVARENLKGMICGMLRQGDILSLITPCQFVLILPNTHIEGAEFVMERIKKSFFKQYPHSPAKLSFSVKPVLAPFGPFSGKEM